MPLKTMIKYVGCWRNRNKRVEQKRGAQVAICGHHLAQSAHRCINIVLTLRQVMRTRWRPPVRSKWWIEPTIRGTQVYKYC